MNITVGLNKTRLIAHNAIETDINTEKSRPLKPSISSAADRFHINPTYRRDTEPEKPKIEREQVLTMT